MYQRLTTDDIDQRRRELEAAAAQMRLARTLRRRPTSSWSTSGGRLRWRATTLPCPIGER